MCEALGSIPSIEEGGREEGKKERKDGRKG
jgi:hypothetical protein